MYDELVKRLREYSKEHCPLDRESGICGCIDAREAADAIEELNREYESIAASLTESVELVRKLQQPRWIPVTERLPEEKRASYLCRTDGGYCKEVRWTNIIYGLVESDNWGWCIFDVPQFSHVTHWMPLPEPPKEET